MSAVIEKAIEVLKEKLAGTDLGSTLRIDIEDEGSIMVDGGDISAADGDADASAVVTASADTFQKILEGDLDATSAYMSGKLKLDGGMGVAMKLASALA